MKKLLTVLTVLLLLVLAACGKQSGDETVNDDKSYQFFGEEYDYIIYEVRKTEQNFYYDIVVLKDDDIYQTLRYESEKGDSPWSDLSQVICEADVNFDGKNDILLFLGRYGTQLAEAYACFLYKDGSFEESVGFSKIANPVIDSENKVILSSWRNNGFSYGYAMYRYIDGEIIKTDILTIGMLDDESGELILSRRDEVFINGEWQIREYFTQNDFNDNGEWYFNMMDENDYWGLSSGKWRGGN